MTQVFYHVWFCAFYTSHNTHHKTHIKNHIITHSHFVCYVIFMCFMCVKCVMCVYVCFMCVENFLRMDIFMKFHWNFNLTNSVMTQFVNLLKMEFSWLKKFPSPKVGRDTPWEQILHSHNVLFLLGYINSNSNLTKTCAVSTASSKWLAWSGKFQEKSIRWNL